MLLINCLLHEYVACLSYCKLMESWSNEVKIARFITRGMYRCRVSLSCSSVATCAADPMTSQGCLKKRFHRAHRIFGNFFVTKIMKDTLFRCCVEVLVWHNTGPLNERDFIGGFTFLNSQVSRYLKKLFNVIKEHDLWFLEILMTSLATLLAMLAYDYKFLKAIFYYYFLKMVEILTNFLSYLYTHTSFNEK